MTMHLFLQMFIWKFDALIIDIRFQAYPGFQEKGAQEFRGFAPNIFLYI